MPAEATTTSAAPLRTAAKHPPVAAEGNSGCDHARYLGYWTSANGDCQNTRSEVLQVESTIRTTVTASRYCTVKHGKWATSWDNRTRYSATTVQIDHIVPVAVA